MKQLPSGQWRGWNRAEEEGSDSCLEVGEGNYRTQGGYYCHRGVSEKTRLDNGCGILSEVENKS